MTISGQNTSPPDVGVPQVLFEDNHVLAICKPAGWQTQSSESSAPDALSWAKFYLKQKYSKPGNVFLGMVHRLDKPVTGVLVFARTSKSASRLSESIRSRSVEKRYLAWVQGSVSENETGEWVNYLSKEADPRVRVDAEEFDGAVKADMKVRLVEATSDRSLLEIRLGSGRKHQIRAMCAFRGHPILGDTRYGAGTGKGNWPTEIALRAQSLLLEHPTKNEPLAIHAENNEWTDKWRTCRI